MKHWAGKVGLILILLALAPYSYVQYRLRSHKWTPLETPLSLIDGSTTRTATFVTDLTGFYNVELAFAPINVDQEECLIGDRLFGSCDKTQTGLDFDWAVFRSDVNGEVPVIEYQRYRPASFGGAGYVGTTVGSFDAQRGKQYRIAISVRRIAPELLSASPKIIVEAGRIYWEKWMIFAQLTLLLGAVVGIPSVAFLTFGLFSQRRAMAEKTLPAE